jgi:hypothetical protein
MENNYNSDEDEKFKRKVIYLDKGDIIMINGRPCKVIKFINEYFRSLIIAGQKKESVDEKRNGLLA